MQPRYISSYGSGEKKPVHHKIEMMGKTLAGNFSSLRNSGFLLNCLPDPASRWARNFVQSAESQGITRWGIHGLNTHEITRYDAALVLQPFLYKYMSEADLFASAGIKSTGNIPQNFVYDITDPEDIYLLSRLGLITLSSGRFNPVGKIQKQSAAAIFAETARMFGLRDTVRADLKTADITKIAEWAASDVKFALSMGIMGVDHNNNFNPEQFITYQEFYNSLVNISRLKEEFDALNNIKPPVTQYFQALEQGTAIDSEGWIHYYNCASIDSFTGKARYYWSNGDIYEGAWLNGDFHGMGRITFADGTTFDGEFLRSELWNGRYT